MTRSYFRAPGRRLALVFPTCFGLIVLTAKCQDLKHTAPGVTASRLDDDCPDPCDDVFSIRFPNALKTEYFFNALTANPVTLPELTTSALHTDTFAEGGNPVLRNPLHDEFARNFMRYLVRCSFGPTQRVSWEDPFPGGGSYSWTGDAALCPEWNAGPPTTKCLRRVSSCILARNNFFGIPVEISMRGANSGPFPTGDPPATVTEGINRLRNAPVPSFSPCSPPQSGLSRNCGWSPDFVGMCTPGARVQLGAGGTPADPTCGGCAGCPLFGTLVEPRVIIRVCSGLDGCDFADLMDPRLLAQDDGTCAGAPSYAPAVGFDCPAGGFFSVMTAPFADGDTGRGMVATSTTAVFPVSQLIAYGVREAAYYGNLFDRALLDPGVDVHLDASGAVVGREEALRVPRAFHGAATCYDYDWTAGQAYAYHRVCALPNFGDPTMSTGCAAHVVGLCSDFPSVPIMCDYDRRGFFFPNYDDWEHCRDDMGTPWAEPITVFLHGACDVPGQRQPPTLCERRR